jgi:hypothetical protein
MASCSGADQSDRPFLTKIPRRHHERDQECCQGKEGDSPESQMQPEKQSLLKGVQSRQCANIYNRRMVEKLMDRIDRSSVSAGA